jgi:hypothetical protein
VNTNTVLWIALVLVAAGALVHYTMPDITPTSVMATGIETLAGAIAFAEGYGASADNAPTRANNPGSLKLLNTPVTGTEGISTFPTPDDGWSALMAQLSLIRNGASHVYTPDMTIRDVAMHWTDTDVDPWASNVVAYLNDHGYPGATVDTTVGAVLG